jgi:tetratricopeptide (TPR) repeat protein
LIQGAQQAVPLFDEAMKLRDAGAFDEAIALLERALTFLEPTDGLLAHTHMQLGHISDKQNDHVKVERHFRLAVIAAPRNELASLGLFHALANLDRWEDAMTEMVRLVTMRDSARYRELLAEGFGSDLSPNLLRLAEEARRLLTRF